MTVDGFWRRVACLRRHRDPSAGAANYALCPAGGYLLFALFTEAVWPFMQKQLVRRLYRELPHQKRRACCGEKAGDYRPMAVAGPILPAGTGGLGVRAADSGGCCGHYSSFTAQDKARIIEGCSIESIIMSILPTAESNIFQIYFPTPAPYKGTG
jgi:hypothetical protein